MNFPEKNIKREKFNFPVWHKKINELRHAGERDRALPGCEPQVFPGQDVQLVVSPSLPSPSLFSFSSFRPSIRVRSLERRGHNTTSVNFGSSSHSLLRAGISGEMPCPVCPLACGFARGSLVFIHPCIPRLHLYLSCEQGECHPMEAVGQRQEHGICSQVSHMTSGKILSFSDPYLENRNNV